MWLVEIQLGLKSSPQLKFFQLLSKQVSSLIKFCTVNIYLYKNSQAYISAIDSQQARRQEQRD